MSSWVGGIGWLWLASWESEGIDSFIKYVPGEGM